MNWVLRRVGVLVGEPGAEAGGGRVWEVAPGVGEGKMRESAQKGCRCFNAEMTMHGTL